MWPKPFGKLPPDMRFEEIRADYDRLSRERRTFFLKRGFDIVLPSILLIILSPVLLAAGLAVKLSSPGPVFFRQERVGRMNRPFPIFKFRSMVKNADKIGAEITVGHDDPRITKVGHILRITRADEFPQLLNIIRGDMSLVGPRPEVRRYVDHYTPEMMATLLIRPGITGTASIAFRNENDMLSGQDDPEEYYIYSILPEKMRINLEYVRHISFRGDIRILLDTLKCAVK